MIVVTHEDQNTIVAAVAGEFTVQDFQELEAAVEYTLKLEGNANLLVDLREMLSFTVDVVWEELRFTRQHAKDFDRVGLIAGSEWQEWSAWLTRLFTDADFEVFEDADAALTWVQTGV